MASFPVYTVDDLVGFTGRPIESFMDFASESLNQALFLVQERTHVYEWPTEARLQTAFRYAILDVATLLHNEFILDYDQVRMSPFSSESIGTYTYTRSNVSQSALMSAYPTGIRWLDILLGMLSSDGEDNISHGGSTHIFENDNVWIVNGERWVLGPATAPETPPVGFDYQDPSL